MASGGAATELYVMNTKEMGDELVIGQDRLYDADVHVPELYDQLETKSADLALIRYLIGEKRHLRILEPFCGTGRLALPLAQDGHLLTGIDASEHMIRAAAGKSKVLSGKGPLSFTSLRMNALTDEWPAGMDVVILAGNCFYELPTPEDQHCCIRKAYNALRLGGLLYVDNDHMEGTLAESWMDPKPVECFPSGTCADGTILKSTMEAVWYDAGARLVRFRRKTRIVMAEGQVHTTECLQQKHPVGIQEVRDFLTAQGFKLLAQYGNYDRGPCDESSDRAIFWAEKPAGGKARDEGSESSKQ
jgi:SAM-dependent methyltransferase